MDWHKARVVHTESNKHQLWIKGQIRQVGHTSIASAVKDESHTHHQVALVRNKIETQKAKNEDKMNAINLLLGPIK